MKLRVIDYKKMRYDIFKFASAFEEQRGTGALRRYWSELREESMLPDSKIKDFEKRFRWDLLRASKFDLKSVYEYAYDDHIDTALRKIVAELEEKFP